jgi:hypothetical protein
VKTDETWGPDKGTSLKSHTDAWMNIKATFTRDNEEAILEATSGEKKRR